MNSDWTSTFGEVYGRGLKAWRAGRTSAASMFDAEDAAFLARQGCTTQELFDFIEDVERYGEPDFDTALAVAAIRRAYFLDVLKGQPPPRRISMSDLPPKAATVAGIPWLPRIIEKARAKLRGTMPDDLMYDCGGDRDFFRRVHLTAPQFLELVRDSGDDNRRIIEAVTKAAGSR